MTGSEGFCAGAFCFAPTAKSGDVDDKDIWTAFNPMLSASGRSVCGEKRTNFELAFDAVDELTPFEDLCLADVQAFCDGRVAQGVYGLCELVDVGGERVERLCELALGFLDLCRGCMLLGRDGPQYAQVARVERRHVLERALNLT